MNLKWLLMFLGFYGSLAYGTLPTGALVDESLPDKGNFSLPGSQQPGPFVSFGQNIIGRNQLQLFLVPAYSRSSTSNYSAVEGFALYGITEKTSILAAAPFALNYKDGVYRSSGISDMYVQGEHAFYEAANTYRAKQATVVGAFFIPTGSNTKNPPTGNGTYNVFAGTTYNETHVEWLWFVSPGINWFGPRPNQKLGNQYLYQGGIGKTFLSKPNRFIFSGLLELDGLYSEKDTIFMQSDPNSGGNLITITPSLWYSNQNFILQCGLLLPLWQHLNGTQTKTDYLVSAVFTWNLW